MENSILEKYRQKNRYNLNVDRTRAKQPSLISPYLQRHSFYDDQDYTVYVSNQLEDLFDKNGNVIDKDASFMQKLVTTPLAVGVDLTYGVAKGIEGIVDAGASIIGSVGGLFDKSFGEDMANFVANDYTYNAMGEFKDSTTDNSFLGDGKIGNWLDETFVGIGQMLPSIAITVASGGTAGMIAFGVGAGGSASEEALNEGADIYQATAFGIVSGLIETATEYASGGIQGIAGIDTGWLGKRLPQAVKNTLMKSTASRLAGTFLSEGLEEVASDLITPYAKRLIYDKDAPAATKEQLLDSFVVGGLSGVIMGGTSMVIDNKVTSKDKKRLYQLDSEINDTNKSINKLFQESKFEEASSLARDNMQKFAEFNKLLDKYDFKDLTGNESNATIYDKSYEEVLTKRDALQEKYNGLKNKQSVEAFNMKAKIDNYNTEAINFREKSISTLQGMSEKERSIYINRKNLTYKYNEDGSINNNYSKLNMEQQRSLDKANEFVRQHNAAIGKHYKLDIDYDNKSSVEGNVDLKRNLITINANTPSGKLAENIVKHEATHTISGTKEFAKLKNEILLNWDERKDGIYQKIFNQKKETYAKYLKNKGDAFVRNYIDEEIVADYVGKNLFNNKTLIDSIAENHQSLASKVLNWIKTKLSSKYASEKRLTSFLEKAEKMYINAIEGARKNRLSLNEVKHSFSSISKSFGDASMEQLENGEYKNSDGYKKYLNDCVNVYTKYHNGENVANISKKFESQIGEIVDIAVAMKKVGLDIEDIGDGVVDSKGRAMFSSLEPNSDYVTSNDIDTICNKRKIFSEIYDDIVAMDPKFFMNLDNFFKLQEIMAKHGLTTPCRSCFVESMRKNLMPMAHQFISDLSLSREKMVSLNKPNRLKVWDIMHDNDMFGIEFGEDIGQLNLETLTTEDGLRELRLRYPCVYEAFNSTYGQSKPKLTKQEVPFRFGELTTFLTTVDSKGNISLNQKLIDKINSTGGIRLQSYSDFQLNKTADVLQFLFEAQTLGLAGHAYTKVPYFIDLVKGTGLKSNISIFTTPIFEVKNGKAIATENYQLDKSESFNAKSVDDIYNRYVKDGNGDIGMICVTLSKNNAAWVMRNYKKIGYFIPFHKSGLSMRLIRMFKSFVKDGVKYNPYGEAIDHQKYQSEKYRHTIHKLDKNGNYAFKKDGTYAYNKANTKVSNGINFDSIWEKSMDKSKSMEENIKTGVTAYLDECIKNDYIPKFAELYLNSESFAKECGDYFIYEKESTFGGKTETVKYYVPYGYFACLGDFTQFDSNGNVAEHKPISFDNYDFKRVKDMFDPSVANKILKNEKLQNVFESERENLKNATMEEIDKVIYNKKIGVEKDALGDKFVQSNESNNDDDFRMSISDLQPKKQALFVDDHHVKPSVDSKIVQEIKEGDIVSLQYDDTSNRVRHQHVNALTTHKDSYAYCDRDGVIKYFTPQQFFDLQGFSRDTFRKAQSVNSNSQLYKQAGNSISVPVAQEIVNNLGFKKGQTIDYVESFGGISAFNEAMRNLGFKVNNKEMIELDKFAVKSLNKMYDLNVKPMDVRDYVANLDKWEKGNVDLFVFGSPCQSNSDMNNTEQKGFKKGSNTKSSLVWEAVKMVKKINPKVAIYENLANVSTKYSQDFNDFIKAIEDMGYTCNYKVLNSIDFGLPQTRTRTFAIFQKDGKKFDFNKLQTKKVPNLLDYFDSVNNNDNYTKYSINNNQNDFLDSSNENEINELRKSGKTLTLSNERLQNEIEYSVADGILDYAKSYSSFISPQEFLELTVPPDARERFKSEISALDIDKLKSQKQTPFLYVDFNTGEVMGHEGRHRMWSLMNDGYTNVQYIIKPYDSAYKYKSNDVVFPKTLKGQKFNSVNDKVSNLEIPFNVKETIAISSRNIDKLKNITNNYESDIRYSEADSVSNTKKAVQKDVLNDANLHQDKVFTKEETGDILDKTFILKDENMASYLFKKMNSKIDREKTARSLVDYAASKYGILSSDSFNQMLKENLLNDINIAYDSETIGKTSKVKQLKDIDKAHQLEAKLRYERLKERMTNTINNLKSKTELKKVKKNLVKLVEENKKNYLDQDNDVTKVLNTVGDLVNGLNEDTMSVNDVRRFIVDLKDSFYENSNQFDDEKSSEQMNIYIDNFIKDLSDTPELTFKEIVQLKNILRNCNHIISNYNNVVLQQKNMAANEVARDSIKGVMNSRPVSKNLATTYLTAIDKPTNVIRSLDGSVGSEKGNIERLVIDGLRDAQDKYNMNYLDLAKPFDDFYNNNKKYAKSLKKEKVTIGGVEVERGQALYIYALSEREQAKGHFLTDVNPKAEGFKIYNNKGDYVQTLTLTTSDIVNFGETMSDLDKEYVSICKDMFQNKASTIKQNADIENYGFTDFLDDNYVPIMTDRMNAYKRYGDARLSKSIDQLFGLYFNKKVVAGANNNLRLMNMTDVVNGHIDKICKYGAYMFPVKNIQKVLNRPVFFDENGKVVTNEEMKEQRANNIEDLNFKKSTLRQEIAKKNQKGNEYIDKLIQDSIDVKSQSETQRFMGKLRSKVASSALGANVKVWFNQWSSIPSACAYINPNSMLKASKVLANKSLMSSMDDYTNGYTKFRNYTKEVIKAESNTSAVVNGLGDVMTKPIQKFDRKAIQFLWASCQCEIEDTKGFKLGTEENKVEAGKLLVQVCRDTQPNYSNIELPSFKRSDNEIIKSLGMFTTQPLQNFALLYGAIEEHRQLKYRMKNNIGTKEENAKLMKEVNKKIARNAASVTAANLMYVLIGMAFKKMLGKDDKDENIATQVATDFVNASIGMMPIIKDLYSAFSNNYDFTNSSYSMINDCIDATKRLYNAVETGKMTKKQFNDTIIDLSKLLGVPTKNVEDYTLAIINGFDKDTAYKYRNIFYNNTSASTQVSNIKDAINKKDMKSACVYLETYLYTKKNIDIKTLSKQQLFEYINKLDMTKNEKQALYNYITINKIY